jgi:hypothetical protein
MVDAKHYTGAQLSNFSFFTNLLWLAQSTSTVKLDGQSQNFFPSLPPSVEVPHRKLARPVPSPLTAAPNAYSAQTLSHDDQGQ